MTLAAGSRLGPYEILAPLGEGGMGAVYRARDTRLDRSVAVKVLAEHVAASEELRARFDREARAISALNHPHICTLHDVGHQDGTDYLVMELVEGESLADRLARGPLPLEQVLRFGGEIAGALDRAHRQGIVHRDLKPGNVMLTKSGVKLLDFGLAKLQPAPAASSNSLLAAQPTALDKPLTNQGMLLGTFQYMAPEQLEGKEADFRADIWALGCVLYEMATGQRAFAGSSQASLISAILKDDPAPLSLRQPLAPASLERLIRRCLAKDPEERWQSAHDVMSELRWIGEPGSADVLPALRRRRWPLVGALATLALLLAGVLAWRETMRGKAPDAHPLHAYLVPPEGTTFHLDGDEAAPPTVSPDGTRVVYGVFGEGDRLWLESLSTGAVQPLSATERGRFPFWSPDSRSVGFFADGELKRIDVDSGAVTSLAPAGDGRGGAWGSAGWIVYAPSIRTGLYKVAAGGGKAEPFTTVDAPRQTTHRWPSFLADGRHVLYLAANHTNPLGESTELQIASIEDGHAERLMQSVSNALFVPGWLLTVRGSALLALPFDATARSVTGEPVRVAADAQYDSGIWRGVVSASDTGVLVYRTASDQPGGQLAWYDRSGKVLGTVGPIERTSDPRLSPDGRRAAVTLGDPAADAWIYDLDRGLRTRLTVDAGIGGSGVWSPDGSRIALLDHLGSPTAGLALYAVDGRGADRDLMRDVQIRAQPTDWSPDGRYLLIDWGEIGATDIWLLPIDEPEKRAPFIATPFLERHGQFSPDGRWVAYTSRESGRDEVYVVSFPGGKAKTQISTAGGTLPRWRADGREIFYLTVGKKLVAAQVRPGVDRLEVGDIQTLFPVEPYQLRAMNYPFDVSKDGQRFLIASVVGTHRPRVALVANWQTALRR